MDQYISYRGFNLFFHAKKDIMNYEIQFAQLGEESKLIFQSLKLMNICKHNIYITVDNSSFYAFIFH